MGHWPAIHRKDRGERVRGIFHRDFGVRRTLHGEQRDRQRQSDGKIAVAGDSSGIDGAIDMFVTRFNTNGTLDTGLRSQDRGRQQVS